MKRALLAGLLLVLPGCYQVVTLDARDPDALVSVDGTAVGRGVAEVRVPGTHGFPGGMEVTVAPPGRPGYGVRVAKELDWGRALVGAGLSVALTAAAYAAERETGRPPGYSLLVLGTAPLGFLTSWTYAPHHDLPALRVDAAAAAWRAGMQSP